MPPLSRLVLLGLIAVLAPLAHADELPAATPYRPTLANPAELPAPGWLELEGGWLRSRAGDARRTSLPYTAKLAFNADWGILVGGEARIRETMDGFGRSGFGDTSIVLKHRLPAAAENLNFGIEVGIKAPTAHRGLGSGQSDWTVNGIASLDFAPTWRLDANLGFTRLGARAAGEGLTSTLWAASVSKSLDAWSLAAEYAGTHRDGVPAGRQWLVAASYALTPQFVLDIGAQRNRQGGDTQHSLLFGFTWVAARVF